MKNNKLILKSQQTSTSKKYKAFTEEINRFVLCANDYKRIQSSDSIETYAYRRNKDLTCKKGRNVTIKQYKNDSL